jgi:hypothetical protein
MKNQISKIAILIVFVFFSSFQLQAEAKNKPVLGEWLYEVDDAPYGYEKGSLIFSEKDRKTVCVIKIEAGELTVTDLKIAKNKITFTTTVQGNSINVDLTRDKNKLAGRVDSPEGPKMLTATKK